ncbi:hypothetical protein P7K49_003087 [Saguinus oedipus]|uniref:Uncharacterized protein n=1 Tax=Saguinus oedipus TaxID=9490 RepID=A0ABQ9WK44_SAGOE|nr:hypothetical protein P7K49_003087 [Saguinus oedipus]
MLAGALVMEDCNVHSAASILASVKEQEARFERLTRALEQERRHVALQLERAQQPGMVSGGVGGGQPLPMAWQQLVLQEVPSDLPAEQQGQSRCLSQGNGKTGSWGLKRGSQARRSAAAWSWLPPFILQQEGAPPLDSQLKQG